MDQLCSTGNLCPDFSESVFSHFGIPKYCWSILLPLMQTHFPSWQINLLEVIPRKTDKGLVGRNLKKPDCSLYERLMHNEIWETCTAVSFRLELCQTLKIQDSLVRYVSDIFFFFFSLLFLTVFLLPLSSAVQSDSEDVFAAALVTVASLVRCCGVWLSELQLSGRRMPNGCC